MSTHPRIEARVSAQERRQINLDARIEELSEDITASYHQISTYLGKLEDRFDKIEATMVTKDEFKQEIKALENRMLDAFKQLITIIDTRLPPTQN